MSVVEQEQKVVEKSVKLDTAGRELVRAAEIVRERWGQADELVGSDKRCAYTSVVEAQGLAHGSKESFAAICSEAIIRFQRSTGFCLSGIYDWNDAPGRTAEEVATALERAAYGL